ncbi:hemin uptake protein HemP [Billgrantia endophytica]|uniref:Hemin uptake protein HemP n=1 Tax=Billgrantia endophytica TaxID=2033802 RepID=A0A2N7U1P3_9GAMM|nr:hemin uptake protein HemP [Halomonas endophytica]PMR74348.1 hemin uptake protein HemP [Halomonas endophytica]
MKPPDDSSRDAANGLETCPGNGQDREVDSRSLLGPDDKLIIHHEGRRYVLRRTRLGKLILTT